RTGPGVSRRHAARGATTSTSRRGSARRGPAAAGRSGWRRSRPTPRACSARCSTSSGWPTRTRRRRSSRRTGSTRAVRRRRQATGRPSGGAGRPSSSGSSTSAPRRRSCGRKSRRSTSSRSLPRADAEQLLAKASLDGAELEYVEPDELRRELDANGLPLEPVIVRRFSEDGVDCADVRFVSELHEGGKVHMRGWLCRPAARPGPLPPLLVVPGGKGQFADSRMPRWLARKTGVALLAVDWIGAGRSDGIPGLDPWLNAVQFDGDDYRASYQLHNLRGLARATELLLSQPFVDAERLMALGSSWGAFYVWLLAGLDARFRHLFVTYGCGFLDTECRQVWESAFAAMGPERAEVWLRAFDPGRRAHLIGAEVFFQQATNDRFYSLVSSMQTFDRVRTRKRLLLARNQDH